MLEYLKHCNATRFERLQSEFALVDAIRKRPLQKKNMMVIAKKLEITDSLSSEILGMSLGTYRKMKPSSYLSVSATENVVRLCDLYGAGIKLFDGDSGSLINWLNTPIPALMNFIPFELITSSIGIGIVKEHLLLMEYSCVS